MVGKGVTGEIGGEGKKLILFSYSLKKNQLHFFLSYTFSPRGSATS
jgi:hypothetical protein